MIVEQVKYTIWAADSERARIFYESLFGANLIRSNPHITELDISGAILAIHGGGEGKRTWTGLTFQVANVVDGSKEVIAHGGLCPREPQPEDSEPPHLAMCVDPEGNEFMLTRKRS